ncbi:hypothetical protein BDA96_03G226300 [Sorghum bicolor]|uniref:Uncharacterized protein n=2 Tax=Sorghum bicolor TaxID=4558 RepID=A0A921RDA7_SORBI|nr:hypothetical protein BDA96_03G226300 [Sorghum bicolor]KXG32824.1 hypothetical protein SORBI_3003G208200 [Sorghum bicolor]
MNRQSYWCCKTGSVFWFNLRNIKLDTQAMRPRYVRHAREHDAPSHTTGTCREGHATLRVLYLKRYLNSI